MLALVAAGIGELLSGFLQFDSTMIKAGSAFAVFALVYFRSPANLIAQPRGDNGDQSDGSSSKQQEEALDAHGC